VLIIVHRLPCFRSGTETAEHIVALQCLTWYTYRWRIERYHYILKSGCQVEKLQLETRDRLMRALAVSGSGSNPLVLGLGKFADAVGRVYDPGTETSRLPETGQSSRESTRNHTTLVV
jgi:hypothetical protein